MRLNLKNMNQKVKELMLRLIEKTDEGNAFWSKTSGNNSFQIVFPNGAVTISQGFDGYNQEEWFNFSLFNNNGESIYNISSTDTDSTPGELDIVSQLFNSVLSSYYKVDITIDSILEIIDSNATVGNRDINTSNDDGLPFWMIHFFAFVPNMSNT